MHVIWRHYEETGSFVRRTDNTAQAGTAACLKNRNMKIFLPPHADKKGMNPHLKVEMGSYFDILSHSAIL